MLSQIRYIWAYSSILAAMKADGVLTPSETSALSAVCAANGSRRYGQALLKAGIAADAYQAAAAVFVRLALTAERAPHSEIRVRQLEEAARLALVEAGASDVESDLALLHLRSLVARTESDPHWANPAQPPLVSAAAPFGAPGLHAPAPV